MISIELVFPEREKRMYVRVDESMKIGDFKTKISRFLSKNNCRILMFSGRTDLPDGVTIREAGLRNGSGVIIEIE